MIRFIVSLVVSYLVGSVPTAYIFGKVSRGIDIREHGSGNVGAANVFRVLGRGYGITVLTLDILKGVLVMVVVADVFAVTALWQLVLLALSVVSGHNWTVFLGFKGGKGIATSLGALIGLTVKLAAIRLVLLLTLIIWFATFFTTRIISLASIAAAVALPLFMVITGQSFAVTALGVIFCVFVVLRHRPNIKRLLNGQEPRALWKGKSCGAVRE